MTKAGVGYGVDETQKVVDDGKGWVWLAAEMSPGGGRRVNLCVGIAKAFALVAHTQADLLQQCGPINDQSMLPVLVQNKRGRYFFGFG